MFVEMMSNTVAGESCSKTWDEHVCLHGTWL